MWYIINAIQALLIFIWFFLSALVTFLIPTKKGIFFFGRNIWGPVIVFLAGGIIKRVGDLKAEEDKNYIFMANHESFADIPVLMSAFNRNMIFMARKTLLKIPGMKVALNSIDAVLVDTSGIAETKKSIEDAVSKLKNGRDIIVFPEGTRTKTGNLGNFKKGMFQMAINSGTSIIPVGVIGSRKVWRRNNYQFRPGIIKVKSGDPINPADFKDIDALILHTKNEILRLREA